MVETTSYSKDPFLLALAGGSCSGKTTLAAYLQNALGKDKCLIIRQDNSYHDISLRGGSPLANFDVPEALDFDLLRQNLMAFKAGQSVALPQYDFVTHKRTTPSKPRSPKAVIIVEGILLLNAPQLKDVFDYRIYMSCEKARRLTRRLDRDMRERGRFEPDIRRQFNDQVEPAHLKYVSPSKQDADLVINQDKYLNELDAVTRLILSKIR